MKRWGIGLVMLVLAAAALGEEPNVRAIIGRLNALALDPDPSAREEVLQHLDHTDPAVRRAAMRALGYLGDPTVLPDLERFAEDGDPLVRVAYLFALMRLGGADAMAAHAAMAQDPDPRVRLAAEAGLTRFGLEDHREALRRVLQGQDMGVMPVAAAGLVLGGGEADLRAVAALLDHPMDEVRNIGAQALGDAAPEPFVLEKVILAHNRETYSYVSASLAQAVVRLGSKAPEILARSLLHARHKGVLVDALRAGKSAAGVEAALLTLLNQTIPDPLSVLDALRHFDTAGAGAALRREAFRAAHPPDARAQMLRWLGERKDREAIADMRKALEDPAPVVRAEACYALSRMNDRESAPRAQAMLRDPNPLVVKSALAALRNYRYRPAKEAVAALADHPDAEIRQLAQEAREAIHAKEVLMKQDIYRLGHDAILVRWRNMNVYFDPFRLPDGLPKADLILITHDHYDHLSPEDIRKVATEKTVLVLPEAFAARGTGLVGTVVTIAPGRSVAAAGLEVRAVPAYNPAKQFHPKSYGGVGYFVTIGQTTYYHAGDTDLIPEMKEFPPADVCFLPVSGTYVMTAQEAAEATKILKCGKAIPMHYGAIVGEDRDAQEFKKLASCPVEIRPVVTAVP